MPETDEGMTQLSVRIPEVQHARLREVSEERMVGMGVIVGRAIAEYLDRLPPLDVTLATENTWRRGS